MALPVETPQLNIIHGFWIDFCELLRERGRTGLPREAAHLNKKGAACLQQTKAARTPNEVQRNFGGGDRAQQNLENWRGAQSSSLLVSACKSLLHPHLRALFRVFA
jgi:hypothetical protein